MTIQRFEALEKFKATFLIALVVGLWGCASPTQKSVADWHDAVVAVREQSVTTFRAVNDLVREAQLKRAGTLAKLEEADFQVGLDADSLAAWNSALDSLAAYGAALSGLLSPDLASGVGSSTKVLGQTIATSAKSDVFQTRPGLASALEKLGTKLTSVAAGQSAKNIMVQADESVSGVLNQMARMINDDSGGSKSGVYQTVHANWTLKADEIRAKFLRAQTAADKEAIASQYATTLAQRDAADTGLLSLRRSLLDLAAAHSRMAAGGSMDATAVIASIREQTAFFKDLIADLRSTKN